MRRHGLKPDCLRHLLAGKLEKGVENPFSCCVLAGQRSTDERRRNLAAFKEGDIRFLVCTDVAARGLDIAELPYVINMTLPDKEEDYVHRVGRVGRADVMGLAISIVSTRHKEKVWYYDKRKWEGKALSTKLASEGGCCIWYDEPTLLKGVQTRLGTTLETLDAFLIRQPGGVASLTAQYGQAKEGGLNDETAAHLAQLAPEIAQLAALETQAQLAYFRGSALSALRRTGAAEGRPIAAAGGGAAGGGAAGGGAAGGGAAGGGAAGGTSQKKALELSEPMDTEAAPKSRGHHKGGGGRGGKGGAGGNPNGGRCAPGKRGRQ